MKRVLCPELPRADRSVPVPAQEAEHLTRVLRLRDGDVIEALDGRGNAVRATLRIKGHPTPQLEYLSESTSSTRDAQTVPPITLEMSILKGDAMEWVVEKAVELGVRTLVPLVTAHTVVQIKNKGPEAFRDRWQKIADQALKQSGRLARMEVALPTELNDQLTRFPQRDNAPRLWADEATRGETPHILSWLEKPHPAFQEVRLLIGPEGGWSELERQLLEPASTRVALGPWVLRAETAALFTVSLLSSFDRVHGLENPNLTNSHA